MPTNESISGPFVKGCNFSFHVFHDGSMRNGPTDQPTNQTSHYRRATSLAKLQMTRIFLNISNEATE